MDLFTLLFLENHQLNLINQLNLFFNLLNLIISTAFLFLVKRLPFKIQKRKTRLKIDFTLGLIMQLIRGRTNTHWLIAHQH
jgi:hypothetical protein